MKPLDIPINQIRVMLARAREREGWEHLRDSMADVGLRAPVQVRDLGRANADGFRYELICGQGRLEAAKDLGWETIPALVVDVSSAEMAGRFLAENMIRRPLPWATKGRMIRDEIAAGASIEDVAAKLHISAPLAAKYLRVVNKIAHEAQDQIAALPINDAEVLTTIPARGQKIVLDIASETGGRVRDVAQAVKQAVKDGAGWTKAGLLKALRHADEEIERYRRKLKLLRLHRAIGPGNIERLLRIAKIKAALKQEGVNVSRFEQ